MSSGFLSNVIYKPVVYPRNVTVGNYLYFVVAPTFVYETSYPRTTQIRKMYVAWHSLQACACAAVQYVLLMQFYIPTLRNSVPPQRNL
ncbi:Acyl-CoA diacylglycerol acyltransferase [Chondrus crispus]|nr:Acyl-CoA diacylglycerol acyltransferase [Chondrus crispus]CDF41222.1 Acyl-CoA diacylglycerol acyltransferase [Chondrus crispus]|eukprot:XP_005711516.1 Acyl-CoA diacylglycerol acyltransferase [Chondrus crispus]